MLAIETRYLGATESRGSRIVAHVMEKRRTGPNGYTVRKLTVGYDSALDSTANHYAAATALIRKLGWTSVNGYGPWVGGASERGYVFVCNTKHGTDLLTI